MQRYPAPKINLSSGLLRFLIKILIQGLSYIKYTLMLPLFGSYLMLILAILLVFKKFFFGEILGNLIVYLVNLIQDKGFPAIFAWLSLAAYVIGSLIEYLFKKKIELSFSKRTVILLLVVTILGFASLSYLFHSYLSAGSIIISTIIFIVFLIVSFPLFIFSGFFTLIINNIIKLLQQNESKII